MRTRNIMEALTPRLRGPGRPDTYYLQLEISNVRRLLDAIDDFGNLVVRDHVFEDLHNPGHFGCGMTVQSPSGNRDDNINFYMDSETATKLMHVMQDRMTIYPPTVPAASWMTVRHLGFAVRHISLAEGPSVPVETPQPAAEPDRHAGMADRLTSRRGDIAGPAV